MLKKRWAALLVLLCAVSACLPGLAEGKAQKKITVMVYMCGSNLESSYGSASVDIQEMLDSRFNTDQINVLVMTGGTKQWSMGFSAEKTMIHEIGKRGMRTVWPGRQDDAESLNMGSPATLRFFLEYGIGHYPAREYALILWDHGGGPMTGACWDELFSMDCLSLKEITDGLRDGLLFHTEKLSWIGFDACLMSSVEVANAMAPYAGYMIASQEMEPSHGWDYSFFKGLEDDADGAATGRRIIDAFFAGNEGSPEVMTLSCIDLGRIRNVGRHMDAFFEVQAGQVTQELFPRLSSLRMQSRGFGKAAILTESNAYDLVDLGDLVSRLDSQSGEPLLKALGEAVVCSRSNTGEVSGLSVYHPYQNKRKYIEAWHDEYFGMQSSQGYADYMFRFGSMLTSGEMIDWGGLKTGCDGIGDDDVIRFSCPLTADQAADYVSARLIILTADTNNSGNTYYTMIADSPAWLDGEGVVRGEYGGNALYAVSGQGTEQKETSSPLRYYLTDDAEGGAVQIVLAKKEPDPETPFVSALIRFDRNGGQGEAPIRSVLLLDSATQSYSTRAPFIREQYSTIYFPMQLMELPNHHDDGTLPAFGEWRQTRGQIIWEEFAASQPLTLVFQDGLLTGKRMIAVFEITDARQNSFCSYPAQVPNPNRRDIAVISPERVQGDLKTVLRAQVNCSRETPGVNITLEMTSLSAHPLNVQLDDLRANGARQLIEYPRSISLQPGETRPIEVLAEPWMLAGMTQLDSLEAEISIRAEGETGFKPHAALAFALAGGDVRDIVPEYPVLAEAEKNGLRFELLDISPNVWYSSYDLMMHVKSGSGTKKEYYQLAVNGIQMSQPLIEIGPDMDRVAIFHVPFSLGSDQLLNSQGAKSVWTDLVLSDDVLFRRGVRTVQSVTIGPVAYDTAQGDAHVLVLREPWPLERITARNEETHWYGALAGEDPDRAQTVTLLDFPDYAIRAERVFAGDNGFEMCLEIENRTDLFLELMLKDCRVNGEKASLYESCFVLPHCTLVRELALIEDQHMAPVETVEELSFRVSGIPQAEDPEIRVTFLEPLRLGVFRGTTLEHDRMAAQQPEPPAVWEGELPIEPGIAYQFSSVMYTDWNDGIWRPREDPDTITFDASGLCVYRMSSGGSLTYTWAVDEEGRVVVKWSLGKSIEYLIYREGESLLAQEGTYLYRLEPAGEK